MSSNESQKPTITPTPNGPYRVSGLQALRNRAGKVEVDGTVFLCRCGGSQNKPFCDGTHRKNGFSDQKLPGRIEDKREDYAGAEVIIHDNRGICAHAGFCTDGLPAVFRLGTEPWIDPDGAGADEIIATIRRCPSGALSYAVDGVEFRDREGEPAIYISADGPYHVTGGPELLETERGEGASTEHYTLCRCGGSKNKPFCDGTHWYIEFTDERN